MTIDDEQNIRFKSEKQNMQRSLQDGNNDLAMKYKCRNGYYQGKSDKNEDDGIYETEIENNQLILLHLYELAKSKQWEEIIERARRFKMNHNMNNYCIFGCDFIISSMKYQKERRCIEKSIIKAVNESCLHDPPYQVISTLLRMSSNPTTLLKSQNNATKSTPLHIACYAGANLQVIQLLIEACPDTLLTRNKIGWTPLHLLCWGTDDDEIAIRRKKTNREINIAKSLLLLPIELSSKTAEKTFKLKDGESLRLQNRPKWFFGPSSHQKVAKAIQLQDKIGWTPLHLACWAGASFDLIHLLIKHQKQSSCIKTIDGWTPIHLACRYQASVDVINALLEASPQSAMIKAKGGWCPIHLACWWQSSSAVIRSILKAYPTGAKIETWEDYIPLEILWQRHIESDAIKGHDAQNTNYTTGQGKSPAMMTETNKKKSMNDNNKNNELYEKIALLLHAACCQTVLDFTVQQRNGPLPLIYALSAIKSGTKCPRHIQTCILQRLATLTEEQVKNPIFFSENRSFLSLSIELGITWDWGLKLIFEAFPEAICIRDRMTGLYPFMQAAVCKNSTFCRKWGNKKQDVESVSTIYKLLRVAPFLVSAN